MEKLTDEQKPKAEPATIKKIILTLRKLTSN